MNMKVTPREYTEDEVREQFLRHVWDTIEYWYHEPRTPDTREKLEGLAFSILTILDGDTDLPGFIVAPCPHLLDKQYRVSRGENWYSENYSLVGDIKCDIGGCLHELFHGYRPKKRTLTI